MSRKTSGASVSGMLNLSRNLGLITGAAVMGAVFALDNGGSTDVATARAEAVANGMRDHLCRPRF